MTARTIQHPPEVARAARVIEAAATGLNTRAFMVGGYVRDNLLGRPGKDIDVVVENGRGTDVAELVAQREGARDLVVFPRFGTAQLQFEDLVVEFVSARSESYASDSRKPIVRPATLEEDMRRRDFTVNALIADAAGNVRDLTGAGLADLAAGILRTPLPAADTFAEDPLRAVRAVRFAVGLGFALDAEVVPAITANLDRLVAVVSVERVNEELRRMTLGPRPGEAFRLLVRTGIAGRLLPEVAGMAGISQTGFHHLDVLDHTLAALDSVALRPVPHFDRPLELRARLGMLFHDTGKPATAMVDGDKLTFYGHPDVGAEMTATALRRLRFSGDEVHDVARLVALHMRPIQYDVTWSDGAVRRLVRDAAELLPALLTIADGDMAASEYPPEEAARKMNHLRRRVDEVGADVSHAARSPLDGHARMERYQRPGGPWVKVVQDVLVEAILDGALPAGDVEAAWNYIDRHPGLVPQQ
ncbi:MAG: HD domain-containing protein [Candidatus Dormibacteria bacterium]